MYNLEEVPISGRRRFNIISPQLEAWIAAGTLNEIKEAYQGKFLPEWDPRVRQVKKVLYRLLPYVQGVGLEDVDWEVNVIDSPEQNAFVIPGYVDEDSIIGGAVCRGVEELRIHG